MQRSVVLTVSSEKKSGHCPLFRIRSCRIAGLRCCQYIRGQRRSGRSKGIIPFSTGCDPKVAHADLLSVFLEAEGDTGMTN
jgi:hypothetical protein